MDNVFTPGGLWAMKVHLPLTGGGSRQRLPAFLFAGLVCG
jgi:hypothetical protein